MCFASPRPRAVLRRALLASCLLGGALGAACSAPQTDAKTNAAPQPLLPTERRMLDPAGPTLITQWTAPGETLPRVVQAKGYRSGMGLIDGVKLVFHAQHQRWMLMRDGVPIELLPASPGERIQLTQPAVDVPVIWQARFRHLDKDWSLAVTQVQVPPPEIPGVSSEGVHALGLLLIRNLAEAAGVVR